MSDVVLTLEGLTKTYNAGQPGEVSVLAGADLAIASGEMVALVAPSGAGKSTLLHMAGLLDTPDAGRVLFGARDMTGLNDHARTLARREQVMELIHKP
ncbi:MAG: ATP-binding cassette domain-containing protein, partial [Pseudomonadota bacterium]